MARSARELCHGSALLIALAAMAHGQGPDLRGLGDGNREQRYSAMRRLRLQLTADDLPAVLASARSSGARAREDLTEVLLDREDLLARWLRDPRDEDFTLLQPVLGAVFRRKFPNVVESPKPWLDGIDDLVDIVGDTKFWTCTAAAMDLDDYVAEIRWARVYPCPVFVDPLQAEKHLTFFRGVASRGLLGVGAIDNNGVRLQKLGTERLQETKEPSMLIVGEPFFLTTPPERLAEELLRTWRSAGDARAHARIATAILALGLSPLDSVVVGTLADRGEGSPVNGSQAAAAFRAILDVPTRGASLLAASPAALDAFGRSLGAVKLDTWRKVWRVVLALPGKDASGRAIDAVLCQWYSASAATSISETSASTLVSARPFLLGVLAARRSPEARPLFEAALDSGPLKEIRPALAGLQALDAIPAAGSLWKVWDRATGDADRAAVAASLASASGAPEGFLSRLDASSGAARGLLLGGLLRSGGPEHVARAVADLAATVDVNTLTGVLRVLGQPSGKRPDPAMVSALVSSADGGSPAAILALDALHAVKPDRGNRYAAVLVDVPVPALQEICDVAAGRVATTDWTLTRFRQRFLKEGLAIDKILGDQSNVGLTKRLARLLGSRWRHGSRDERARIAEDLTGGENAAFDVSRDPSSRRLVSLNELAALFVATDQLDLIVAPDPLPRRPPTSRMFPSVDRGPRFPETDAMFEAWFP